eukprot:CAMPEP_0204008238 /NCGR_PEP_ID=MMETSP0360-20130528/21019_1 /ASSEMBLY_ACC=CAM_ASM_000342 /TAXON_ID=268821 /ORGANISM="Scrippsiella Hangoei, Strain SHTV-5" /LENGTH=44 /DNA_ID= /DNA_START= /DNA_END= /DNA_ORIENTATION=
MSLSTVVTRTWTTLPDADDGCIMSCPCSVPATTFGNEANPSWAA